MIWEVLQAVSKTFGDKHPTLSVLGNIDPEVLIDAGLDPNSSPDVWIAEIKAAHAKVLEENKRARDRRKKLREAG